LHIQLNFLDVTSDILVLLTSHVLIKIKSTRKYEIKSQKYNNDF